MSKIVEATAEPVSRDGHIEIVQTTKGNLR